MVKVAVERLPMKRIVNEYFNPAATAKISQLAKSHHR
jgi:hypothetical protein